ncbi:MAG: PepSY-associated TM helix domain-containing protein [Proteobacteria bacterium]|nr:PepSY-associated TM helix domain-containing protein [Pseudomonadota bacterium]
MSSITGSVFRRVLFWAHLSTGVAAGLLILLMSATGVLLAYEKQLVAAAEQGNRVAVPADAPMLTAAALADKALAAAPDAQRLALVFNLDPAMPVTVTRGRDAPLLLHPWTGELLPDAAEGTRHFLHEVEDLHRWMAGDARSTRASLMHLANLLFVFIVLSGLYLWLPAVWRWRAIKPRVVPVVRYVNGKARDYAWHQSFGIWMLVPLAVMAGTGVVMSYGWANQLLFAAYGEQVPQRGGGGGGGPGGGGAQSTAQAEEPGARATLDQMLTTARVQLPDWQRITLPVKPAADAVDIVAEVPGEGVRLPRRTVTVSAADASVIKVSPPPAETADKQTAGQRARTWVRFAHTGEYYGVIGQTVAALASLLACVLVYTGLALAWRRLIRPRLA